MNIDVERTRKNAMQKRQFAFTAWVFLLGAVAVCYWPGLYGGFVFDDDVNILQNASLQIKFGSWNEFWSAGVSGHAGPLGRPIALLSFALNYYWAGAFDPFQFKIVNLFIHIVNSVLVGCFSQLFFKALNINSTNSGSSTNFWVGWVVAALWALHPLNLTAVLYVVQRMTSLSTLFGLIALISFTWYRLETYTIHATRRPVLWTIICGSCVVVSLLLSVLTKESGALFLPLLLWTEIVIFRFQYCGTSLYVGRWTLRVVTTWGVILCIIYIFIFKLPSMIGASAYANRDFTLTERVLTEARVLIFYLRMLVVPVSSKMSLYHDDFEISRSLFSPASTFAAFGFLIITTLAAWLLRGRFRVLIFGWGWFLISHALESTIFPLELVYEHRNYFATIGLLLIVPAVVLLVNSRPYKRIACILIISACGLFGFITYVRSLQWSNNIEWALLEASNKPYSMRAKYELGRVYILLLQESGNDKFGDMAEEALEQSSKNDPAAVLPIVARLQLAYLLGRNPAPELIKSAINAFGREKYRNVNTAVLASLINCQVIEKCSMADEDVLSILAAALANPHASSSERAEILKLAARYLIGQFNDFQRGVDLIRQAIEVHDGVATRIMYAQAIAMAGNYGQAMSELDVASSMDGLREYSSMIARERKNIQKALENP